MSHHPLHNFSSSALACLLLTFLLTASSCTEGYNNNYTACLVPYNCGKFTDISYPFWGNRRPQQCGHPKLKLNCENNTTTTIQIDNVTHTVLEVNQETHVLKIARTDLSKSLCTQQLRNASLDPSSLLEYAFVYSNLTLTYGCTYTNLPVPYSFDCPVEGISERTSYVDVGSSLLGVNFFAGVYSCHVSVVVPVSFYTVIEGLKDAAELVRKGFEVGFKAGLCGECENSGGRCGYGDGGEEFVCFCANGGTAARGERCDGGDVAAHRVGGGESSTLSARVGNVFILLNVL